MSVELSRNAFAGPLHALFAHDAPLRPADTPSRCRPRPIARPGPGRPRRPPSRHCDRRGRTHRSRLPVAAAARERRRARAPRRRPRRVGAAGLRAPASTEPRRGRRGRHPRGGCLDEVADGVRLLCEQSSWCWPAHDDTHRAHGSVLATVTDPFLDLGAGEVVAQLAWIDQVLGGALDERYPGLRARIRLEARVRVIEPFLRRRDWHWLGLDGDVHNWNPWIHGNVLVAALALVDDDVEREAVVRLAVEGLDRYVAVLPDDGAIDEGYAYWWNGACRALEALDLLAFATEGRWDAAPAVPALRETVAFPHRMHLGGPWYVNLADGPARPPPPAVACAAPRGPRRRRRRGACPRRRAPGADVRRRDRARRVRSAAARAHRPRLDRCRPRASPLPRDVWLASTQVLLARPGAGSAAGLSVVVKGGHNGEHHNHNDVGSFIVAVDGVPVVVDAGRPTYTAPTFGPDRYDIWTMQSSWHNVPEIAGTPQGVGAGCGVRGHRRIADDGTPSTSTSAARTRCRVSPGAGRCDWTAPPGACTSPIAGTPPGRGRCCACCWRASHGLAGACRVLPLGGARPVRLTWPADADHRVDVRD